MALGRKKSSKADVQESALPEVCFNAIQEGNGVVWVQIRKKESRNTFAVWTSGGAHPAVTDEKIGRKALEEALETGNLQLSRIRLLDCNIVRIRKILRA